MLNREMSPLAKKLVKRSPPPEPTVSENVSEVVEEVVEEVVKPPAKKLVSGLDIKAIVAAAKIAPPEEPEALCLLLIGTRQSGKSTALGTVKGVAVLFTTSDEAHSIETARAMAEASYGATIIPVIIDMKTEENGRPLPPSEWVALTADQAIIKLTNYLDALEATENISESVQWVAIDSIYSLFKRINEKKNIQQIATVQKNNFKASAVALKELLDINQKLLLLQKRGVNIVVTCPAAAEQDKSTGLYDQIEPLLEGYRNNLHVVGIFPDICTVGKAIIEAEGGEVYTGYFFQFGGSGSKAGKKVTGEERCINFKPRINAILDHETPDFMNADLTELAEYKRAVRTGRKLKE
jgi:hypothetical protein